jgi:mannose-6-phosphate isomerase class I
MPVAAARKGCLDERMRMTRRQKVLELLHRWQGIIKLRPEMVRRFYPDFNRLGQARLKRGGGRQFIPERWIGSSVQASNPPPIPGGGLSMLADGGEPLSLRDALQWAPHQMLGNRVVAAHGPEFRVLVKLLDPGEPIVFHLHASDNQVRRLPRHFRGHRFGKDEAYYFLDAPKGPMPYTHAGLYEGVTRRNIIEAVRRGPQHALELSPSFYQAYEGGFFVPAGVPHRPGTALTLEIQQPSDVYTLLETHAAGRRMPPRQIHPGFRTLDDAFRLIDHGTARAVGHLGHNHLRPSIESRTSGGEIATIFPPAVCKRFAGRRLRVNRSIKYAEEMPLVLWIWRGRGTLNGRRAARGDEFFITRETAAAGIQVRCDGDEPLEAFTFFPVT